MFMGTTAAIECLNMQHQVRFNRKAPVLRDIGKRKDAFGHFRLPTPLVLAVNLATLEYYM